VGKGVVKAIVFNTRAAQRAQTWAETETPHGKQVRKRCERDWKIKKQSRRPAAAGAEPGRVTSTNEW